MADQKTVVYNDDIGGAYDDMLGEVRSAITGGTAWNTAAINDTGFLLGWLRNNSSKS